MSTRTTASASAAPEGPLLLLQSIVEEDGARMAAAFYDALMQDLEAKAFLSHSVVHGRLSAALLGWLKDIVGAEDIQTSARLQEQQKVIGKVHARIKVPIHLVMEGGVIIKRHIADRLIDRQAGGAAAMRALQLAGERIDRAIMIMSQAYVKDTKAGARLEESYRLFSMDQDFAVEKEAQRASLMEWGQKALFSLLRGNQAQGLTRLAASDFGFWLRHRAELMFQHSAAFEDLTAEVRKVDQILLPQLEEAGSSNSRQALLADFQASVDRVSFLVGELFQALTAMESGRDPLTRALNRRFLPAILGREVTFANENAVPLTILLVDVDHFKAINDQYGHQTGDAALRQVAQIIMQNVRPSDFVFRYGGEEFLIVLAETSLEEGSRVAERIRANLAAQPLEVGGSLNLPVTASIGLAPHTGHPDQSYLIKAADDALYAAKGAGRNRVEVASSR